MRMNETINTIPEYERLRADYEKRLQEVEQNYQKQLIQMADEAKRANMAKTDFLRRKRGSENSRGDPGGRRGFQSGNS